MTSDHHLIASMRFHAEPDISWSPYFLDACADGEELTELGQLIAKKMQNALFIDIPCGKGNEILPCIEKLGFTSYIGVDREAYERTEHTTFDATYRTADILEFLSKYESNEKPTTIYISGLQPDAEDAIAIPYLNALYDECKRILTPRDLLILNDSDTLVAGISDEMMHPSVALHRRGFSMQRCCRKNKVQAFEKK